MQTLVVIRRDLDVPISNGEVRDLARRHSVAGVPGGQPVSR